MTAVAVAPGLPADWLNGWLAAVGVTVLVPEVRLGWTDDPTPLARFEAPPGSILAQEIASALPALTDLDGMVIPSDRQVVRLDEFPALCRAARAKRDPFLASSVTDLVPGKGGDTARSAFYPPAPGKQPLSARLIRCRSALGDVLVDVVARVEATLEGRGSRVKANGLGFDYRRLRAAVHGGDVPSADILVDPIVECLCFASLELFPVRGSGVGPARTRGWMGFGAKQERFVWPAWTPVLDRWAIDALLDATHTAHATPREPAKLDRLGVVAMFESVRFKAEEKDIGTVGYASRRLR